MDTRKEVRNYILQKLYDKCDACLYGFKQCKLAEGE